MSELRAELRGLTDEEWLAVRQAAIQWAEQVHHGQPGPEPLLSAVAAIRAVNMAPVISLLKEVRDAEHVATYLRAEADQALGEVFGIKE